MKRDLRFESQEVFSLRVLSAEVVVCEMITNSKAKLLESHNFFCELQNEGRWHIPVTPWLEQYLP